MEQPASYPYPDDLVSTVSAGEDPPVLRHVQFSPRDLVVNAVENFVTRMADRDISVVSDIYYSVPGVVFGDGRGVQHLLDCLLDDAGKLARKGRIHVACRFEDGFPDPVLVFTVRLAGMGVRTNATGGAAGGDYFSVRIPVVRS